MTIEPHRAASLVAGLHAPWRATVGDCLARWMTFNHEMQAKSFLVVEGDIPGDRQTLGSSAIAKLLERTTR